MSIEDAYNHWSAIYDSNENKTRDLEATILKKILNQFQFTTILELGCGTGKNTEWLLNKCESIVAVDFSENMLQKAKEKIASPKIKFIQADINKDWKFVQEQFNLINCSLVLEHIKNLHHIFKQAHLKLEQNKNC